MLQICIDYWTVIVTAAVSLFLSFLWYGLIFGKQWIIMMGWTPEQAANSQIKIKKER